jgi:hypothetical protein
VEFLGFGQRALGGDGTGDHKRDASVTMDGFEVMDSRPGQLSLAVDKLKGNQDLTREVQAELAGIRGIQQVSTDPDRGLLVVAYDKSQLTSFTSLLALKATFSSYFPEVDAMKLAFWLSQSL